MVRYLYYIVSLNNKINNFIYLFDLHNLTTHIYET